MVKQRGFLLLILIIVIVVVAATFAVASRFYIATTLTVTNQFQDKQAYYLAQGSLQHGIRAYAQNINYAGDSGQISGVPYITQVFATDFTGNALPTNQKRIRGSGIIDNTTRIVEAIVQQPNYISEGTFDSALCSSPIPWIITSTSDAPAPKFCGVGQGNLGNALLVQDNSGGNTDTTATQTLISFNTTGSTDFIVKYQYKIPTFTGNNSVRMRCCFNNHCSNWVQYNSAVNSWTNDSLTITVPNNQTVTNFNINMEARGNGNKIFLTDNFTVSRSGAASLQLINYRDVLS